MGKYGLYIFLLCIPLALWSIKGNAEDGTDIKFSGRVIVSPCEIDTHSVLIDFGDVPLDSFNEHGKGGFVSARLKLVDCPISTKKITATFSGEPETISPLYYYRNKGTAKNIQIELKDADSNAGLGNGCSKTVDVRSDHTAIIELQSRVNSEGKNATPGTVSGVVQVDFTYQ
ncbi:fimbrial protein [Aeromonas salmonicida]|uniref:fimbrial protein n=1 Tax=Aeromonas salmonicida TaxID=645 RepID=UPI0027965DD0|nr:fimbrial protein [Aeromonas salmonicida]MDQ1884175.1 fimbrial protein [Aeromonas salmonicida]